MKQLIRQLSQFAGERCPAERICNFLSGVGAAFRRDVGRRTSPRLPATDHGRRADRESTFVPAAFRRYVGRRTLPRLPPVVSAGLRSAIVASVGRLCPCHPPFCALVRFLCSNRTAPVGRNVARYVVARTSCAPACRSARTSSPVTRTSSTVTRTSSTVARTSSSVREDTLSQSLPAQRVLAVAKFARV